MPVYEIEHPKTGQKIRLEGDGVPTDSDIREAFASISSSQPKDGRTPSYDNRVTDKAEIERKRREFVQNTGTGMTRIKEGAKAVVADAMPYVRPLLEGGGAAAGGIIGAGAGMLTGPAAPYSVPVGGVAGGSLGYAIGKNIADTAETAVGLTAPKSLRDLAATTGQDIKTGAMYEMGGQLIGRGIGAAIERAPAAISALKRPIQTTAQNRARQTLEATTALSEQEAKNLAQSEQLANRLGVKLTPAQMTGNPATAAMEQGLATADPAFAGTLNAQDAAAKDVALKAIRGSVGAGKPAPSSPDLATTGQNITNKIEATLEPIKAQERELWAKVPNYPIPTSNFDEAASAIKATPMEADTEVAVNKILDFANRMPKTTQGLQSIERTIGDKMTGADANIRRILGDLKKAIGADFKAMGEATDAGDIAIFEGKIVNPSKMRGEIENLQSRIAAEKAASSKTIDLRAIQAALKDAGDPPNQWMKQVNESAKQYEDRLANRYRQKIDANVPTIGGAKSPAVTGWEERINQLASQLDNLQPAEDVAAAYKAAKDFSRTQKFDRFGKGAVARVTQRGNEASGLRTADENIGRQFFTPSGSAGLVKAIGQGAAKEQMRPFVIADLTKAAAPNGVDFNVKAGRNYLQKNRAVLERLGLTDDVRQVLKEQFPAELERKLVKRAPDAATGAQFFTSQDMRGILQEYGSFIKQEFGTQTLTAFRDYNSLMTMIERKNVIPRGGNSNTAEKAMNLANLMIKESVGPAKKLTDGLLMAMTKGAGVGGGATLIGGHLSPKVAIAGASLNGARQMLQNADSQIAKAFVKILQDATINPQVAKDLMHLQRTGKVSASLQSFIDTKLSAMAAGAMAAVDN